VSSAKQDSRAGVTHLQTDAIDHIHRVDDVAQRLGHLAAVRVAHHRVQIYLQVTSRVNTRSIKARSHCFVPA
jgi:hypothetical protein